MEDVIGAHDILCVENIGLTYFRGKLCAEFVQRCVAAVVAGLYFDGGYFFALGNQEIDLHVVFPMLLITARVEVELMPTAPEHLCHHVLQNHALVYIQLVKEDGFIQLVVCIALVHECLCHQKSRVRHVAFLCGVVGTEGKPYIGVGGIEAGVDHHRLVQPDKGILIGTETRIFAQRTQAIFLFFFG